MSRSRHILLAAIFVVVGCGRIASTYPVFNQVYGEPYTVATGMQWLDTGQYRLDPNIHR